MTWTDANKSREGTIEYILANRLAASPRTQDVNDDFEMAKHILATVDSRLNKYPGLVGEIVQGVKALPNQLPGSIREYVDKRVDEYEAAKAAEMAAAASAASQSRHNMEGKILGEHGYSGPAPTGMGTVPVQTVEQVQQSQQQPQEPQQVKPEPEPVQQEPSKQDAAEHEAQMLDDRPPSEQNAETASEAPYVRRDLSKKHSDADKKMAQSRKSELEAKIAETDTAIQNGNLRNPEHRPGDISGTLGEMSRGNTRQMDWDRTAVDPANMDMVRPRIGKPIYDAIVEILTEAEAIAVQPQQTDVVTVGLAYFAGLPQEWLTPTQQQMLAKLRDANLGLSMARNQEMPDLRKSLNRRFHKMEELLNAILVVCEYEFGIRFGWLSGETPDSADEWNHVDLEEDYKELHQRVRALGRKIMNMDRSLEQVDFRR